MKIFRQITSVFATLKNTSKHIYKKSIAQIDKRPLRSFFGLLTIIILLIVIGNFLRQPSKQADKVETPAKVVEVYSIGAAPRISLAAKIEKSGALKLTSQSPGFVQTINHWEGEYITRGTQLFWLSTNAIGGTIPSVSRQIAQQNYNFLLSTYDIQVETIKKQREIAEKAETQSDELRAITDASIGDTRNLISLNEQILGGLDTQLAGLSSLPASDSAVLQVQQARSGVLAALNGLRSGLRNAEFQASNDSEPAKLAQLQKDIALKGLELQEKSLALNKEISRLNVAMAQIGESLMYPVTPCNGVIERIYVNVGQSVVPGTLLVSIKCDKNWTSAVAALSGSLARNISKIEKSTAIIKGKTIELTSRYITQEPIEGNLHGIIFDVDESYAHELSDGDSIIISVPVGVAQTTSIVPYVPLDAVYQTETDAYMYVAVAEGEKQVAKSRAVTLGTVYGSYVEVKSGLEEADIVIVNRNILEGDTVTFNQ